MLHRIDLRSFDVVEIEEIVRYSAERFFDMATGRRVVIGRCNNQLVVIPYEIDEDTLTPVTIHATDRQQINLRIQSGRFIHE